MNNAITLSTAPQPARKPAVVRRVERLAAAVNADIQFIGIHPLFEEVRVYRGRDRDWVLAPAHLDPLIGEMGGSLPIPRVELERLRRLVSAVDFPAVYIGHDVPSGAVEIVENSAQGTQGVALAQRPGARVIDEQTARSLVSSVPPPRATLAQSQRLGEIWGALFRGVGTAATAAIGIALAPLVAIPSLFQGVAFADPVILGAVPHGVDTAAWFVLAQWDYGSSSHA